MGLDFHVLCRFNTQVGKTRVVSSMMCKGGVGKTTVSFLLSWRIAQKQKRVLIIDSDPQGNLTAAYQAHYRQWVVNEETPVLVDVLLNKCSIGQAIVRLSDHLHVLPSTALNSLLEKRLIESVPQPIHKLQEILRQIDGFYDYIIIDSAPSLSLINAAIMLSSHTIILPVSLDEFSRLGLEQTLGEIRDLQTEFNFSNRVRILINQFDPRSRLSLYYLSQFAENYLSLLYRSTLRLTDEVGYTLVGARSALSQKSSKLFRDVDSLVEEIMEEPRMAKAEHANI